MIPDNEHLYLEAVHLFERGWTESLITKFLGNPDRWRTVNHWANFKGKRSYYLGRVEEMENNPIFNTAFLKSIHRRKLTAESIQKIVLKRKSTEGDVKRFEDSLTDNDVKLMGAIKKASEIIEEARRFGYRTPNK